MRPKLVSALPKNKKVVMPHLPSEAHASRPPWGYLVGQYWQSLGGIESDTSESTSEYCIYT